MAKAQKKAPTPQLNAEQWATLLESLNGFITASSGLAENIKNVVEVIGGTTSTETSGECTVCPEKPPKTSPCGPKSDSSTQKSSEGDDKETQQSSDAESKKVSIAPTSSKTSVGSKGSKTSLGSKTSKTSGASKTSKTSAGTKTSAEAKTSKTSIKDAKDECPSDNKTTTCTVGCGTKKATSSVTIKDCVPTCKGPGDTETKKDEDEDADITLKGCKPECPSKSILKSKAKKKRSKDEAASQKQQMLFLGDLKKNLKNMQCTMAEVEEKIRLMERLVQDYDTKNKPCGELNPAALYKEIMKPQSVPFLKAQREQRVNLGGENSSKGGCTQKTCHASSSSSVTSKTSVKVLTAKALPDS